jgi:hypothetical protein
MVCNGYSMRRLAFMTRFNAMRLILVTAVVCSSASARDKGDISGDTGDTTTAISGPRGGDRIDRMVLADQIYIHARDTSDPYAFITAAGIYQELGSLADGMQAGRVVSVYPETFWSDALAVIGNRKILIAELEARRKRSGKWLTGSSPVDLQVSPEPSPGKDLEYQGGQPAIIHLRPANGEVRVTVSDDRGVPVCQTAWTSKSAYCRWVPRRNGKFRISAERKSGQGTVRVAAS